MTDLPPGWQWAKLGDLCDINPRTYDDPPRNDDHVSFVPMAAVEAGTNRLDTTALRIYGSLSKKSLTRFQESDVIFAKITPCMENGKIAIARRLKDGKALGSTEFHVLRSRGAVLPEYLVHYLLDPAYRRSAERQMTGAVGQRRVTRTYLEGSMIPLPPLGEQHRIVAALEEEFSRIDEGFGLLDKALDGIDALERAIVRASLVSPDGEASATASKHAQVDDGRLPPIPSSWQWMRLHEIAEVVGGVTKDTAKQSDPSIPLVPYLRVANVQRGWLDLSEVSEIRVPEARAKGLALEYGDVLLNEGGDRDKLGRGWIWEGQIDNCIHQNHVFRIRIKGDQLHPKLLAWHANSFGKSWFERNGRQTTNLASISLSKIKQLPVPVPPIEDQRLLVEYIEDQLTVTRRTVATVCQSMNKASHLRRSLLAEAFAGRLVPQDPEDEPASVLRDRIRVERENIELAGRKRRTPALSTSRPNRDGAGGG